MDSLVRNIIKDNVNLYGVLGVDKSASLQEIRRAYRKQALIHHPDKQTSRNKTTTSLQSSSLSSSYSSSSPSLLSSSSNALDNSQFDLILTSFQILSDELLRQQYDTLIDARAQRGQRQRNVNDLISKFQNDLLNAEKGLGKKRYANIELLRQDGLKRMRLHEEKILNNSNKQHKATTATENKLSSPSPSPSTSLSPSSTATTTTKPTTTIDDIPLPSMLQFPPPMEQRFCAILKYKNKKGVNMDESVLGEIMEIFGPIKKVTLLTSDDRYAYATIEYINSSSFHKALKYDYSTSLAWDGTKVKKLASLLRSLLKSNDNLREEGTTEKSWTNSTIVNKVLENYVGSVSDNTASSTA